MTSTEIADDTSLWKTAGGTRAHLRRCSHLVAKDIVPAKTEPVCELSQAEIEGRGRTTVDDLAAALPMMGVSDADWAQVRTLLEPVEYDEVWLPFSKSYIALGNSGQAVAWVGKNYVDIPDRGRTELPNYTAKPSAVAVTSKEVKYGVTCPTCFLTMPLSGIHHCW